MTYFYQYELVLAGIILLSAMAFGGIKIWLNRRKATKKQLELENAEKANLTSDESNK